jgi:branched-chain amino acid transport system permease protein
MSEIKHPRNFIPLLILFALALLPTIAVAMDDRFLIAFFARVLIYAVAASALNIALGIGGLVSLGHALFYGIGMYCVSMPVHYGITSGWVHLALAVGICALVGLGTGLVSLRTTGISFIMITLSFAQMGYFIVISLKQYGGDDGMSIASASDFGLWKLSSPQSVYYTTWVLLAVITGWVWRLRMSSFGMILRAGRQNARRVASIGVPLRRYQLTAYALSAMLCGVAGLLSANLNAYASPSAMSWVLSGDLIVIVVLGGMGSVFGPLLGALAFLGLEEVLKPLTEHWMMLLGLCIVAMTLMGATGLVGLLSKVFSHPSAAKRLRPKGGL